MIDERNYQATPEGIIEICECAITRLQRATGYAKNLPNQEAKEALSAALKDANRLTRGAVTCFKELDYVLGTDGNEKDRSPSPLDDYF